MKFVEGLQEGANIVLAHWHYYKRDFNTLVTATKEIDPEKKKAAVWGELKPDQVNLLRQTREAYENIGEGLHTPMGEVAHYLPSLPLSYSWDADKQLQNWGRRIGSTIFGLCRKCSRTVTSGAQKIHSAGEGWIE